MNNHFNNFIDYMKAKNRSPLTIKNYHYYYLHFSEYVGDITPEEITLQIVDDYTKTLIGRDLDPATISYHLIFIRNFLKYMTRQGFEVLNYQLIEPPSVQKKLLPALNEKEIRALVSACNGRTSEGLRAKVMVLFLVTSGARVAEIANLKLMDLEIEEHRATIMGKGRKMRVIFFDNETAYHLKKYLESRTVNSPYVFAQEGRRFEGQPLTTRTIERIVEAYGKKAGISKPVYPHCLRRSFATKMLRKGVNIRQLQALMGHSSIETTSRYIFIEQDELKTVHQLAHKRATKSVKEKEMVILSRESFSKLTGAIGKTVEQNNRILKKLGKEEKPLIPLRKSISIN